MGEEVGGEVGGLSRTRLTIDNMACFSWKVYCQMQSVSSTPRNSLCRVKSWNSQGVKGRRVFT